MNDMTEQDTGPSQDTHTRTDSEIHTIYMEVEPIVCLVGERKIKAQNLQTLHSKNQTPDLFAV